MTLHHLVAELKPVYTSGLVTTIATTAFTVILGSMVAIRTYRHQSRELVNAAVAWEWSFSHMSGSSEEPFLVVQNRSAAPAFLIRARYLRGCFLKTEAKRYPFSYDEPIEGSYPLKIKPQDVTSFPLNWKDADRIAARAGWLSRVLCYLLRRSYVWIEATTMSGARLMVPANDVTSWRERPFWLSGRWIPEPKPDWASEP